MHCQGWLPFNWEPIAAFAWEHYETEGRGAVLVPEEDFVYSNNAAFAGIRFRYIADEGTELNEMGGWPSDKERDWVKSYNPAREVILLVVRDNGGTSG